MSHQLCVHMRRGERRMLGILLYHLRLIPLAQGLALNLESMLVVSKLQQTSVP